MCNLVDLVEIQMIPGRTDTAKRGDPDGHRHVHLTSRVRVRYFCQMVTIIESRIGKAVELISGTAQSHVVPTPTEAARKRTKTRCA